MIKIDSTKRKDSYEPCTHCASTEKTIRIAVSNDGQSFTSICLCLKCADKLSHALEYYLSDKDLKE